MGRQLGGVHQHRHAPLVGRLHDGVDRGQPPGHVGRSRDGQQAGLIDYSRGLITIRDRAGLESLACECYGIIKTEYDRLLD